MRHTGSYDTADADLYVWALEQALRLYYMRADWKPARDMDLALREIAHRKLVKREALYGPSTPYPVE